MTSSVSPLSTATVEDAPQRSAQLKRRRVRPRIGSGARSPAAEVALALITLAGLTLVGHKVGRAMPHLAAGVDDLRVWAPALFVSAYALAVATGVPRSLLTLATGAMFGFWAGMIYVLLGLALGGAAVLLVLGHSRTPLGSQRPCLGGPLPNSGRHTAQ